jgi:hypothetical protein
MIKYTFIKTPKEVDRTPDYDAISDIEEPYERPIDELTSKEFAAKIKRKIKKNEEIIALNQKLMGEAHIKIDDSDYIGFTDLE